MKPRWCALILVLGILVFPFPLFGEVVSVYLGDTHRGGFGDIAANVIMAQKLKAERPGAEIHVLVPPDALDVLNVLEPSTSVREPSMTVNGITYHLEGKSALPKSDLGLVFASTGDYKDLYAVAPVVMEFEEYGGHKSKSVNVGGGVDRTTQTTRLSAPAGVGSAMAGLYVSKKAPKPPHGRSKLFELLDSLPGSASGDLEEQYKGAKLGFAYSHKADVTRAYVDGMVALAKKNPKQKYLIVTQHSYGGTVPSNMEVRYYPKLPFAVSESVIAHSDLPILVTGDVSATLAVQHGRPFFYEGLSWKTDFADGLLRALQEIDPKLKSPLGAHLLGDIRPEEDRLGKVEIQYLADTIEQVAGDTEGLERVRKALIKLRETSSLPTRIAAFLEHMEQIGEPARANPRAVLEVVLAGGGKAEVVKRLAAKPTPAKEPAPVTQPEVKVPAPKPPGPWWDKPASELARELLVLAGPERRKALESLIEEAPMEFRKEVVGHLSRDPLVMKQLQTIGQCRDDLAALKP